MSTSTYATSVNKRTGPAHPDLEDVSELDKVQKAAKHSLKSLKGLIGASLAPVSDDTGDGSRLSPEEKNAIHQKIEGDLRDMSHLGVTDVKSLLQIQAEKLAGQATDDKEYLMEHLISIASKLPAESKNRESLTNKFLTQLWNDLEHPPQSYLGAKYQYRSADGSFNSLVHPQLGAAGTPYARTVKPSVMQSPALPDAGVVFDSVMMRKHAELHPNGISSMLFYLASIIIHDCFRTDHRDYANSLTSSYLDLSPLYGSNQDEQDQMKTFVDGRLKPDCFSEARLLFFPPGVGCLLIMFNRFHNHVVENLALINEGGRFSRPMVPVDEKDEQKTAEYKTKLVKFDNDLFQTGRLITCGLYVNIILVDYVRTILDLNSTDSDWQLNPRAEMKDVPIGLGNQVSAEFNLVYRWHSTISKRDEDWTQELWDKLFGKKCDPKTVDGRELLTKLSEVGNRTPQDPSQRPFADFKRNADGTLPEQPLVDLLTSSIKDCANSFGPNRVPAVMRAIEVLGIEQSRAWNLATLNEFRKHFNLEPHRTFSDITSDAYVADQLKHLYGHPDKVEIYPGLVVEDAKQRMHPGSGLTPPYTVSRAVLSDAVALVRGDRFYTLDYNPRTLTNWGFKTVESDLDVDNGCVFYKLFLNAFPRHFKENSVFVHFPLTIPKEMKGVLEDLDKDHLYDFGEPVYRPLPHEVHDSKTAVEILKNGDVLKQHRDKRELKSNGNNNGSATSINTTNSTAKDTVNTLPKALYTPDWETQTRTFYTNITRSLLASKSHKIANFHQIDIVRDIGNLIPIHFVSSLFMLPLKNSLRPRGIFTETDLYTLLSSISALHAPTTAPAQKVALQAKTHKPLTTLKRLIDANLTALEKNGLVSSLVSLVVPDDIDDIKTNELPSYGKDLLQRLLANDIEPGIHVADLVIDAAASLVTRQALLFAQVLEYFLLGAGTQHWAKICAIANSDTDEAFEMLTHYVLEAVRLSSESSVLVAAGKDITVTDSDPGRTIVIKEGEEVFVNLRAVAYDSNVFPEPAKFDTERLLEAYDMLIEDTYGWKEMTRVALTCMVKEVAKLKGLRAAKGAQGKVHRIIRTRGGDGDDGGVEVCHEYLTEMWDGFWAFPCSKSASPPFCFYGIL
jgi:linoleate 8R-lipoxygenase/9,12-octadecadienoate 8-hydroperoxide 8R-isomerase